ncbi:hypothetical protein [Blastococcus litoris]|uniref:hypothetical protein n=1 Tax=Blastococcus litoris TaxID=2171622 RepID=UPI000E306EEB|nr:hypothetical protein [Blastococcus litoris]
MTAPATERLVPTAVRALRHVVLAGVLGVLVAYLGTPVLVASLFGGVLGMLLGVVVVIAVGSVLAFALDGAVGPGALGRAGSGARGFVVGGLGSAAAIGLALLALRTDLADVLPVPLRYAAVAVPFAVLAALQWPGFLRNATAVALVSGAAAVVVVGAVQAGGESRTERIATEVGTTEKPWVSEVEGYTLSDSQVTGSPLVWTRLEAADGRPGSVLWLFRDQAVDTTTSDPCAATSLWTPGGDQPLTGCTPLGDGTWLRTSATWQELARFGPEVRVGVTAAPTVPRRVLEEALAASRPMTDAEYDTWLDEGLPPGW